MRLRLRRDGLRLGLLGLLVGSVMLTLLVGSAAADPPAGCSTTAGVTTCLFAYTGAAQTWTVPAGVTSASFDVHGAQGGSTDPGSLNCSSGGSSVGGNGGEMIGTFAVPPGAVLQVNVGGQGGGCSDNGVSNAGGWNGGGSGGTGSFTFPGTGGGGASDIRTGSYALPDRIIVGGGGGGAAQTFSTNGGTGGGLSGGDGQSNSSTPGDGVATGGTQTGPGTTGTGPFCPTASPGALGVGGNGLGAFQGWGGGGGGGGYYGGGGGLGGGSLSGCPVTGGGGGGSGFIDSGATNTAMNNGVRSGDGLVTITYSVPPPSADVSVTKTDSPDPVVDGQNLTYTLAVHNAGPDSAASVQVSDALPAGATFVSFSTTVGTCTFGGGTVGCSLGTLASGANETVTIVVRPTASGTLTNTGTVSSTTADSDATNNSSTATTTVTASADLSVTKADSPDPAHVGQVLTYTVVVTNSGPDSATGVSLADMLPKATGFGSVSTTKGSCTRSKTGVTCNLGTLASGATATVTIVVKPTQKGTITNTVTVADASPSDPNTANNTATQNTTVKP